MSTPSGRIPLDGSSGRRHRPRSWTGAVRSAGNDSPAEQTDGRDPSRRSAPREAYRQGVPGRLRLRGSIVRCSATTNAIERSCGRAGRRPGQWISVRVSARRGCERRCSQCRRRRRGGRRRRTPRGRARACVSRTSGPACGLSGYLADPTRHILRPPTERPWNRRGSGQVEERSFSDGRRQAPRQPDRTHQRRSEVRESRPRK